MRFLLSLVLLASCSNYVKFPGETGVSEATDADGDGYDASTDCDDTNPAVHPDASELCNGIDDDCDGAIDEDLVDTWYSDSDADGYGAASKARTGCDPGSGWAADDTDCNDSNAQVNPGSLELCNGIDDDCDGGIDEPDAEDARVWYPDADSDGYGDASAPTRACSPLDGQVEDSTDCNDELATVHPGATEIVGDGIDQDCSGDDACYVDADGDGFGTSATVASTSLDCTNAGEAGVPGDCDDASSSVYPGSEELCEDGIDNDCDGEDRSCRYTGSFDLGSVGFKLIGEEAVNQAGRSVAGAGDVDGDGYDDLLVGAHAGSHGEPEAGAIYLVYGPLTEGLDLSAADAKLVGEEPEDYAGSSLASAGDINADGYDDVLVGAWGHESGEAYLLYGPLVGDLDLSAADVKLFSGDLSDYAGKSVASAGDVDDDGLDDVLVGAPGDEDGGYVAGAAYLLYGPPEDGLDLSSADVKLIGEEADDLAGWTVAAAGDVDADGFDDVLVGAEHDDEGGYNAGAAYIVNGPLAGRIDLSSADTKLIGEERYDVASWSVASAADVDMDGYDDVLVGAYENDDGGSTSNDIGAAYLVYGPLVGDLDLSAADAKMIGENAGDWAGYSVASAGDVDNDGFSDLLVGARNNGGSGAAYLVYGPLTGDLDLSSADAKFTGESSEAFTGCSVASAGDVDADGYADLLIGADGDDDGGTDAGAAYLIPFGEMP
jgi:hypothetical protein